MTEQPHHDQLREAFETHEDTNIDPAAVYARVQELSTKYKRRRRGAQIAAGGVLSAGLVAGAINLPAFLPANQPVTNTAAGVPAGAPAKPSAAPSNGPTDYDRNLEAYTEAGYGYDNAGVLARLWKMNGDDRLAVKAEAGRRLLLGETLPIKPSPDAPVEEETISPEQDKQFQAFFNAGYTWTEAEKLAKIWKIKDPADAKLEAGKRLLAGEELPVKPTKENVAAALENKRASAFWEAGYEAEDAAKLAKLWNLKDTWSAKVEAGMRLLAGQELPIKP
ncbi:hypothetical protein Aab01nite_09750 [Paractinoplanes abujensis]|uniref:Uncharacterized protein n=1 Tax=Paractinoplanes abujensis TaxID=882441 RepID=A0A7W7CMF2_9ACTN|nr:hypothetical protein [Actinoplanes abujensis]MBB4691198.1 hypothetical protein [Actinoplanes abujensis]GID17385.1 hypothetical protein Aab01nite_09750 [Actinoplanes abujensis]